jgi:molybdopterin-guanine dinucleotide biosynthesis protein A
MATGAILAGGRARRFNGQDKSRLVIAGESIIVRQVDLLQRVAADVLVIAPSPARFADLPVTVVPDRLTGAGVLGGIYTALDAAMHPLVLIVACDLPFLDAGLLTRLAERAAASGADGAWVRTMRGVEPLLACYHREARSRIRARIEARQLAARELGSVLRMAELGGDDLAPFGPIDRLLTNVNTPADYARVQ